MTEQLLVGIGLVIVAGLLNGSFAAPMKPMSAWRWENSWLIFAATGLVIFPWIITFLTVPHVGQIYLQSSLPTLEKVVLFGIAWGVGSTLFGIGISRVGMALGFAIILGITASFGSFFPLAVLHPEELHTQRGIALMVGTATMIVGLLFLAPRRETTRARQRSRRDDALGICARLGYLYFFRNFFFDAQLQLLVWRRNSHSCSRRWSEQFDGRQSDLVSHRDRWFSFESPLLCVPSQ